MTKLFVTTQPLPLDDSPEVLADLCQAPKLGIIIPREQWAE